MKRNIVLFLLLYAAQWSLSSNHLRVTFVTPDIVRVHYSADGDFRGNSTGVCVAQPDMPVVVQQADHNGEQCLCSDSLEVHISPSGAVSFFDRQGHLLLAENRFEPHKAERRWLTTAAYNQDASVVIHTANGDVQQMREERRDTTGYTWRYRICFDWQRGEALYGLGSHMEDYMNLRGKRLYLCQHNLKAMVPVLNSTAGYGLLFDAGCAMQFYDDFEHGVMLDAAHDIDYYFMKGATMDKTVERYRWLTGQCPMMPRWFFGYTQSRERYVSSDDILQTLREFRRRHIPIDQIVQDWNYWPGGQWGTMTMVPEAYPDKRALADSIHQMHARLMISIWPNAMGSPQWEDFRDRGWLFPGTSVYDAFRPEARDLYWQYAFKEFFSNGFDAWWCDSSEPIDADWNSFPDNYDPTNQYWRWYLSTDALSTALGAERSQLFSLYHARGIYEHQRAVAIGSSQQGLQKEKRVVNLTRSSYAGQQRYATITWNGDTYASWASFAQMIPAGLNFMATGCPYWSIDVGAFFTRSWAPQWFRRGEYPEGCKDPAYRELYCRMLQFATFLPMMRSHGTDTPREPWYFLNNPTYDADGHLASAIAAAPATSAEGLQDNGSEPFYHSILASIRLRYRLLPYIYSLAARVSHEGYTMTRALAFDFPHDPQVLDLKDEFMFGPALLVAPIVTSGTISVSPTAAPTATRRVYLPSGSGWTDFYTHRHYDGGQWIDAVAPIDRIPLYVRDGSILPLGPAVEYADQPLSQPLDVRVYPGRNASFTLYDDAGDGYACEKGQYAQRHLCWDEQAQKLSTGKWQGKYKPKHQDITVSIIRE